MKVEVFYQATPNPDSMKFIIDREVARESATFLTAEEAGRSPLAARILGFPWAAGVMIGPNFVTVTKQNWVEWEILADPLSDLIKEHIEAGQSVLGEASSSAAADSDPNDPPVVQKIKKILREEIQPAVAMDGGDIRFSRFEEGRVYLSLHGACSGCPSSTMTLKEGIEVRLKEAIPEVTEVISV